MKQNNDLAFWRVGVHFEFLSKTATAQNYAKKKRHFFFCALAEHWGGYRYVKKTCCQHGLAKHRAGLTYKIIT